MKAELAVQGDTLHATFKVQVVDGESSAVTNVFVFFEDGTYVSIGDVAAGATVVSDTVTLNIDLSNKPNSRSVPMQITLKYSLDGQPVEQTLPMALTFTE